MIVENKKYKIHHHQLFDTFKPMLLINTNRGVIKLVIQCTNMRCVYCVCLCVATVLCSIRHAIGTRNLYQIFFKNKVWVSDIVFGTAWHFRSLTFFSTCCPNLHFHT